MKGKTLGTLLIAGTLGLAGCTDSKLEGKVVREFTGSCGEKVTESLFWDNGAKYKNRQLDVIYSNGVQVRVVDVYDDGKIDSIYIADNPKGIHIVKGVSPEEKIMRLPSEEEVKQYMSRSK